MNRQYVGIDFHRRRSVIVRKNAAGENLGSVRVANLCQRVRTCTGVLVRVYRPAQWAVLSVWKLAVAHASYYEQSVAEGREDYYVGSGEAPDRWMGSRLQGFVRMTGPRTRSGRDPRNQGMCRPDTARATTNRWISEVPSKIV